MEAAGDDYFTFLRRQIGKMVRREIRVQGLVVQPYSQQHEKKQRYDPGCPVDPGELS
jgi:hypothetical protein